jgi:hypothetical protein
MKLRTLSVIATMLLGTAVLVAGSALGGPAEDAAALEGGTPLPEGAATVQFPWIGKQSIACISDADERMIVTADTSDDKHADVGSVTLDGKGGGTGEFKVMAADLRSGHTGRDEHMMSGNWLDGEKHPEIALKITKLERVKPTVWRITGTWTMKGKTSAVSALANVRYIAEMDHFGKDVVRVKTSFPVSIKAHDVGGAYAGTPAVAAEWKVEVVLLGLLKKK